MVKKLIEKKVKVNTSTKEGKTALMKSFEWGHPEISSYLVSCQKQQKVYLFSLTISTFYTPDFEHDTHVNEKMKQQASYHLFFLIFFRTVRDFNLRYGSNFSCVKKVLRIQSGSQKKKKNESKNKKWLGSLETSSSSMFSL